MRAIRFSGSVMMEAPCLRIIRCGGSAETLASNMLLLTAMTGCTSGGGPATLTVCLVLVR